MASFNKVILMGNLTRDPEVRFTQSGTAICKIGLAVNRRFKDPQSGDWREEPTVLYVTIFGKRGEAFSKFHTKGKPAFIEGELRLDQWEDKQSGQKRSKLYVVGNNWEFVGGGREGAAAGAGGGSYSAGSGGGGGDWGGSSGGGGGEWGGGSSGAPAGGGESFPADDTPF
jgi:single-strand DNA-binding protein